MAKAKTVKRVVLTDGANYLRGHRQNGDPYFGSANKGDVIEVSVDEAERMDALGGTADPADLEARQADDAGDDGEFTPATDEQLADMGINDLTAYLQQVPEDAKPDELDRIDTMEDAKVEQAVADGDTDAGRRKGVDELLDAHDQTT